MLVALTAGQKTGLAVVAAAFVVFALASSFLFPRWSPNFPGRWMAPFLVVCALFTVGMLGAVFAFGKEEEHETAGHATTETGGHTETGAGTETQTGTVPPPRSAGDPVLGKSLYQSQGCGSCHTFTAAGSSGQAGPNLDNLAQSAEKAGRGNVFEYAEESIAEPNAYVVPGFQPNVMPDYSEQLDEQQIENLVAFLTEGEGS